MAKKRRTGCMWVLLCLMLAACAVAWWVYKSGFGISEPVYIYVDADDTVDSIAQKTEKVAKPEEMRVFHLYAGVLNLKDKIRTGRYEVSPDMTMLNFIRNIRNHND